MRTRWTRFLPGYPAVLLVPAVLGLWVVLCTAPRRGPHETWIYKLLEIEFVAEREMSGFPLVFIDTTFGRLSGGGIILGREFHTAPFLADLAVALATAYIVAMAVDRLIIRPLRAARMKKPARREGSPV